MKNDIVNHPKHYANRKIEVLDYIDDLVTSNDKLSAKDAYYIGNVVKYLSRAGLKGDKVEDLKKAQFYLNRLIKSYETN